MAPSPSTLIAFASTCLLAGAPHRLDAQSAALPAGSGMAAPAKRDTLAGVPLFVGRDAWIAAGFVLGTAAMAPLDFRIARELQEPGTQASRLTRSAAKTFNTLGGAGAILIGAGFYGVGRVTHHPRMADLGLHSVEAIVLSGAVAAVVKDAVGRARPSHGDPDPNNFGFGRGMSNGDYTSFPSGHTTAAFAAATVVTAEAWDWWPRSRWVVGPIMYGGATMVGLARLYTNDHWTSDVVLGAGIGMVTGFKVARFNQMHQGNRLDRWLLEAATTASVVPDGRGGFAVGWTVAAQR